MAFDTAGQILFDSEELFEEHTRIEVDLSGVNHTDSAGLALLLEWMTWAPHIHSCVFGVGASLLAEAEGNNAIPIQRLLRPMVGNRTYPSPPNETVKLPLSRPQIMATVRLSLPRPLRVVSGRSINPKHADLTGSFCTAIDP